MTRSKTAKANLLMGCLSKMNRLITAVILFVTYVAVLLYVMIKNIDIGYVEMLILAVGGVLSVVNLDAQFEYWSSQQWKKK